MPRRLSRDVVWVPMFHGSSKDRGPTVVDEAEHDGSRSISLEVPKPVVPYRLNYRYLVTIVAIHALALLALMPYFFSWSAVLVCLLGVHVFGASITIGYHRLLTHRSFKTPKWFEHLLAILGICSMQDTPARWVAVHRMHHVHSDEQPDPHSPKVSFWWSHCGWLVYVNRESHSVSSLEKFAKDLLRDPFYMRLEQNPLRQFLYSGTQLLIYGLVGGVVGWLTAGTMSEMVRLALGFVVWGVFLRVVLVWHITWSVNSLTHLFGYRNYATDEGSRNNWLVALLTFGEGWHNNHHDDPSSASLQHRWWEFDICYYEILLLSFLGLARDIIPQRQQRH